MPALETISESKLPTREKQFVALTSVAAAGLLTVMKVIVGIATGSLGILSDGAHSGLDLIAATITYFSVRLADKPADSSHPFGHGKIEHLSAFIETALLLLTCAWITIEAVVRLFFQEVQVRPSLWAFGAMIVSMVIDTYRSRALYRVARKHQSQALEADALHFSTDIYSSGVVIFGLGLVYISEHWKIAWLERADPIAALVVAALIIHISLRLGRKTVNALLDAAPEGAAVEIASAISSVDGVLSGDRIRVRQSGNRLFVDLRVTLESNIPFEHAQSVVDRVESKVRGLFPTADVVIHAAPRQPAQGDLLEKIRAVAHRHNFLIHDVTAFEVHGRINVSLDLEVDPDLKLEKAHEQATRLEHDIQEEMPDVDMVNIHLEPMLKRVESADVAQLDKPDIERKLLDIAQKTPGLLDCHSVEAHLVGGSIFVRLHCTLEPSLPIGLVHAITEDLEFRFRRAFPQISKVSIHAEPEDDSQPLAPPSTG